MTNKKKLYTDKNKPNYFASENLRNAQLMKASYADYVYVLLIIEDRIVALKFCCLHNLHLNSGRYLSNLQFVHITLFVYGSNLLKP